MKTLLKKILAGALLTGLFLNVNAQTLYLPSGTATGTTTNNVAPTVNFVGIGTTAPTGNLHINAPGTSGLGEVLFKGTVGDATNDFFTIQNGTSVNNILIPSIWGHNQSGGTRGLILVGSTNAASDTWVNNPVISIDGRQYNSGVASALVTRPLFQFTNLGTQLMTVLPSGKIGIGTISPQNKLDVYGSSVVGATYAGTITAPTNGLLVEGNVGIGTTAPASKLDVNGTVAMTGFKLGTSTTSGWVLTANASGVGTWQPAPSGGTGAWTVSGANQYSTNTGGVGINISNPSFPLDVNGVIHCGGSDFRLGIYDGRFQGTSNINRALVHNNNDVLTLNYDGDFEGGVQIDGEKGLTVGTVPSTPNGYKLYVEKGILTERIKIALTTDNVNWSDFVFDKNYKLLPLNELELFVNKNKHLPEIPSANEMYKEGLDVAQMDAKLLQKIEELTLYMIEMKKENEEIKKQNEILINDTKELKKEVGILKTKK